MKSGRSPGGSYDSGAPPFQCRDHCATIVAPQAHSNVVGMKQPFLFSLIAASMFAAPSGQAQSAPQTCAGCFLGVYDDAAMSRTTGTISPFQIKSVYLGIQLGDEVAGLEKLSFEATYPAGFTVLEVTPYVTGANILSTGSRSVRVEWPSCVQGSRLLLFRVRLLSTRSVQNAAVQIRGAMLQTCATAGASTVEIPAGCYVLNPRGPSPCATAVMPTTWSATKGLYKTDAGR